MKIDRDKLRAAIHKLGNESVFQMLDDAIDLLPASKLHKVVKKHLDVKQVLYEKGAQPDLLTDVKAFEHNSLAGKYYESFNVNSKNYREQSEGTKAWIAECRRLLNRCAAQAGRADPSETCQAFHTIFGLLDRIDDCQGDVIFFADEGGSWQVGVDWDKVLPPWFEVLSATAAPKEYAGRIATLLETHYGYGRDKMLPVALRTATPDQRKALADVASKRASRRQQGMKP